MGEYSGSVILVGVRGVDRGDKVKGHLMVVSAVLFLTEVGVLKRVRMGGVDSCSWSELVVFEGGEDCVVVVDKCPEAGRGHDGDELLSWRVLILLEVL